MKETEMLEILDRIRNLLESCSPDVTKQYVELEIENLVGTTTERCKNTKYYFYNWYCKFCSNANCISNRNR